MNGRHLHATSVVVGESALLIMGPSGSGKSSLAWRLLTAPPRFPSGLPVFTRLVSDDQSRVEAVGKQLLVHAATQLAGLIEIRGQGLFTVPYLKSALVLAVIQLAEGPRLPLGYQNRLTIENVDIPVVYIADGEVDPVARLSPILRLQPAARQFDSQ